MMTIENARKVVELAKAREQVVYKLKRLQSQKAQGAGSLRFVSDNDDITVIIPGAKAIGIAVAQLQLQIAETDRQLRALGAVVPA